MYISPENSKGDVPDIDSVYAHLLQGIEMYSKFGDIMVQGDFNAYTNIQPDYVLHDESDHSIIDDLCYKYDNAVPRNNLDQKRTNNSGKLLLNTCKETGMRIVNGRTTGDLFGKQTCITYNGCSLVEYTMVSSDLLNRIGCFKVHDFTSLSDHCPISVSKREVPRGVRNS